MMAIYIQVVDDIIAMGYSVTYLEMSLGQIFFGGSDAFDVKLPTLCYLFYILGVLFASKEQELLFFFSDTK